MKSDRAELTAEEAGMLCKRCANLVQARRTLVRAWWARAAAHDSDGDDVRCAGCGTVLPLEDTSERLLHKLSQLAQFGLAGAAAPLLRTTPVPSKSE
jgi:hypothetical protein